MNWFKLEISKIKEQNLYRKLITIKSPQASKIIKDGKELVNLSSNNYLGLTTHPYVKKACLEAIEEYGTGAGAARLAGGNTELHISLEEKIAEFKGTESAIVFGTGYMTNIGVLSSIMKKGDIILSDELNHASIIDGCRLSKADIEVYPHKDVAYIEKILKNIKSNKKLIVTDGVFSMDGDIAPVREITDIAKEYDAMVMVDDAHATGILGKNSKGSCDYFNVEIDINMGTLSKALASIGGYVAGNYELIDYLRNKARSFIYSTALPPSAIAAAKAAIEVIEKEKPAKKLWKNVEIYKRGLKDVGYPIKSETQIIPIITGDAKTTLSFASELEKKGVFAIGIRPPTVPIGRIRTSIMATHTKQDINHTISVFEELKPKFFKKT